MPYSYVIGKIIYSQIRLEMEFKGFLSPDSIWAHYVSSESWSVAKALLWNISEEILGKEKLCVPIFVSQT